MRRCGTSWFLLRQREKITDTYDFRRPTILGSHAAQLATIGESKGRRNISVERLWLACFFDRCPKHLAAPDPCAAGDCQNQNWHCVHNLARTQISAGSLRRRKTQQTTRPSPPVSKSSKLEGSGTADVAVAVPKAISPIPACWPAPPICRRK